MTAVTGLMNTQALSEQALGVALLHIERGDDDAAKHCLSKAVAGGVSVGGNACLFHGAPALEFVLSRAGRVDYRVQDAVDRVVAARLAAAWKRQGSGALPSLAEFDLIRGLTGLGAVLLTRLEGSPLSNEVLRYLVALSKPVSIDGWVLPGWWSAVGPDGEEMAGGHGNNGVAHGIAGPLALLSIAVRQGTQIPGQLDAIEVFTRWLDGNGGRYRTSRDQLSEPEQPDLAAARPSWCYGVLGVARSQQLAGLALGDRTRQQQAETTALAALTNPNALKRITDASLCHGWAGLLTVTRAIAADSPAPQPFAPLIRHLRSRLAAETDALNKPGFMEGATGAHLALAATNTTGWTKALLID